MENLIDSLMNENNYNELVDSLTNYISANSNEIIKTINELGNDKIPARADMLSVLYQKLEQT
jgi:hypothetical protein